MSVVIDRRSQSSKGAASRQRFLHRTKEAARQAINRSIQQGNIRDIGKDGVDVTVPKGGLSEPHIHHDHGGVDERVLPGNNNEHARHNAGDRLPRPTGGGGGRGKDGADSGSGEDSFVYHLSEEEYLNILFEDLELPNMVKEVAEDDKQIKLEHAGYSHSGTNNRLSLIRSKIQKTMREVPVRRGANEKILALLSEEKAILSRYGIQVPVVEKEVAIEAIPAQMRINALNAELGILKDLYWDFTSRDEKNRIAAIESEVDALNGKKKLASKWNDHLDLRYRTVEEKPMPISKAVMFCKMDVSASMGEEDKIKAKLFFFLLHRFLKRQYEHVDVVYIRHTHVAEAVDEAEFFGGRETGGTVVSSAHDKFLEIQKARYPASEWNIYDSHASDGDNSSGDNETTAARLKTILPMVQGFFYVEIRPPGGGGNTTDLWKTYEAVAKQFPDRFWMNKVMDRKDITPVFRDFFKKRDSSERTVQPRAAAFNFG